MKRESLVHGTFKFRLPTNLDTLILGTLDAGGGRWMAAGVPPLALRAAPSARSARHSSCCRTSGGSHPPPIRLPTNLDTLILGTLDAGGGRWIRTTEGVSQQIYSLPPLAAWVSLRIVSMGNAWNPKEPAILGPVAPAVNGRYAPIASNCTVASEMQAGCAKRAVSEVDIKSMRRRALARARMHERSRCNQTLKRKWSTSPS